MGIPAPTESDIQRIVDLIVAEVQPLRVVLFGSVARGEQKENSDVDLMVLVSGDDQRRRTAMRLHVLMAEHKVPLSVDFVVTTPERFERYRESVGLVFKNVVRDGRELYAA